MQVVILAGGLGTRISEESDLKPKPMIEIGEKPILWHIMKIYSSFGVTDFIICAGYKGYVIKDYFNNYLLHNSNVKFNLKDKTVQSYESNSEPWSVTLVDTGLSTGTAGRLLLAKPYLLPEEDFCLTYGDGVSDINIEEEIKFHKQNKKIATVCAIQPPGRYGLMKIKDGLVTSFSEKPTSEEEWINGGFFIFNQEIFKKIEKLEESLEVNTIPKLVAENGISAWQHRGFWQSMDTLRDKRTLEDLWKKDSPPWKVW
jgi:glucose-1-phosphate cytidylyltransferase